MSHKYEALLSSAVGAMCEVLTRENRVLFAAIIEEYDMGSSAICTELRKGETTPRGVLHQAPVKVRIRLKGRSDVIFAYGRLDRNAADRWWIDVDEVELNPERRANFRQRIKGEAVVTDAEGRREPCRPVDISLSGIGFQSRAVYSEGDRLEVSELCLRKGGTSYVLPCVVRRVVQPEEGKELWFYGCSFQELRPRLEDRLCRDIFALQSREINRR